ncbi:solute carrier family 2, facilitated glucose transporter member 11b isoform X1 [Alosa sapidissima]|uniref:solute carrier family 2, facilitated glucose transporter member 11b isoform X1 n=1 Tax=Alosa sapidissima TaxID=34773 RepID=UPI001C094453|nr:solute carrier family 2, facilitated glucose transporter member 11b isoform X1 [Alosa sapidissima]
MKKSKENGDMMETEPLLRDIKEKHVQVESLSRTLVLAACASCIGGTFQYGFNISVVNAPTKYVMTFINQTWMERYDTEISEQRLTLLWSVIVSIFTIGGLVGSYVGGALSIKYGRKGTLMMNNIFALLAAFFMGISQTTHLFELLIIGRFLIGINAGIGSCVQSLYLGEIAPRALRGAMAMGTSVFITGGIFVGQVVGLRELLGGEEYWPLLLSTTCIPAAMQLLLLPWFPESPRYLLIDKGDERACDEALKQLHGADQYHGEKADIERERLDALGVKPKKPWELFLDQSLRWQLLTIIILNMFQQLNGINAIYFYADYVFSQSGIPENKIPYVTLGAGLCELFTALTCGLLIESLGRRALIIGGYSLMALWCFCFTLALTFQDVSPWVPYLSMICVFAFILSFGLGPGGVTNILAAELFTQTGRPAAYMIGGSVNWLSFFLIGMAFPFIVNGLKQYCFLVFLVVCVMVATFIFLIVPETKNKTFLQIHAEFQSRGKKRISKVDGADGPGTTLLSTSL